MKPSLRLLIFLFVFIFTLKTDVFAQSDYVLPYPSSMPGSVFYKIHLVYENISKYWYFGNFGQFDYNLKMSDKYLVEARALLEYKQYLLGYNALKKSDQYFTAALPNLLKAKNNGKDVSQKRIILNEASLKHVETLLKIESDVPVTFTWSPEKSASTILDFKKTIEISIRIRKENI
jgi:hypothetical protein